MAMNPMQRKIRNSFLFGFLVALILGAVVIGLLIVQNKKTQEELAKAQEQQKIALKEVYVAEASAEKDEILSITTASLPAQYVPDNAITADNIENYYADDDEAQENLQMIAKIAIKENTILTEDMVEKTADAATYRMIEYSMISLPSKLEEGDYIDIRIAYSTGADFVILSKIKVQSCNTNSIWLKVSESQLLLLNNAIIESYIIAGTKLYATQYTNSAQAELNSTYVPNPTVVSLIQANSFTEYDKNVVKDANSDAMDIRQYINSVLDTYTDDEKTDKVNEGYTTEKTTVQAAREALMGDLGY